MSLDLLKDGPLPRGDEVIDADDEGIRRELWGLLKDELGEEEDIKLIMCIGNVTGENN